MSSRFATAIVRMAAPLALTLTAGLALAAPPLDIRLAHGTAAERATKVQLEKLLATQDLSVWQFTGVVLIDETAIPHSHPVLTLHTRHWRDDDLLLSTYLHEQWHWFLSQRPEQTKAAVHALKAIYPNIPVGYPAGSNDPEGNYIHLIVCYLELQSAKATLGELRAHLVASFWAQDHYTWIYREVLNNPDPIRRVLRAQGLDAGRDGAPQTGRDISR